jgi:tetratricopeptide (TPR) repeat protein
LAVLVASLCFATIQRNVLYANQVELWRDSVQHRPHARARMSLATALVKAGDHAEAIRQLRLATEEDVIASFALGTELFFSGRVDESVDPLTRFIAEDPSDVSRVPARSLLGRAFAAKGRFAEAAAEFRAILDVSPLNRDARTSLGDALAAANRPNEAVREYQAIRDYANDPTVEIRIGVALMQASRFDAAKPHFERALTLDSRFAIAHRNLADIASRKRDVAAAIAHAEAAVKLEPNDGATHNFLGILLASSDRFGEAIEHFRAAVRLNPADTHARENLQRAEQAGGR